MKKAIKELLADRRSLKEGVVVAGLFACVHIGMNLIGWGNHMLSWWQALLIAPIFGFVFWLFTSGFRRFRDEDVTPS